MPIDAGPSYGTFEVGLILIFGSLPYPNTTIENPQRGGYGQDGDRKYERRQRRQLRQ